MVYISDENLIIMPNQFDIIDRLAATLKAVQPMRPEYLQKLDKKFWLEFNYNSNHIEGNTLTLGETELYLVREEMVGHHNRREYEELDGHNKALTMMKELAADGERPLTESFIKNLNRVILVKPFWKEAITADGQDTRREIKPGDYKQYPNSVRLQSGEMFEYASPTDTPIEMQELMDWCRVEDANLHPVVLAAMFHYKFVRIHPFDDGNGRIARLLLNYVLLKHNLPMVIIRSSDKTNYLNALHLADVGDYEPFINYIAEQLTWSLETSLKAAHGESIDEPNDIDKRIDLLNKKLVNKQVVNAGKSPQLVYEFIEQNMFPLFELLEEKVEKLKPLFWDYARSLSYDGGGNKRGHKVLAKKESDWNFLKNIWCRDEILSGKISLISFQYDYGFRDLKSFLSKQYFGCSIEFHFDSFTISMKVDDGNEVLRPYDKIFTEDEKNKIVSDILERMIEQIDRAADGN